MDSLSIWAADFETTSYEDYLQDGYTRVYLWGIQNINNNSCYTGDSIESFFKFVEDHHCDIVYFHNLKFDGKFIIDKLLKVGFIHNKECDGFGSFSAIISDLGEWFSVVVQFESYKVTFRDSLKKFPGMSIGSIAETYHIPGKTSLNIKKRRDPFYIAENEERERVINDVRILAYALSSLYSQGMTHSTASSDSFALFKQILSNSDDYFEQKYQYSRIFPKLFNDSDLRPGYSGGWTYLNPIYQNKDLKNITVYDKNSMYPSMMYYKKMPYGKPYLRKPLKNEVYIIDIDATFHIRDHKFPFIQNRKAFNIEMIKDMDEPMNLVLASPLYELFLENYHNQTHINKIYSFKSSNTIFRNYIDHFYALKKNAKTPGERLMSKLALNSLYGKFGQNPIRRSKTPLLIDNTVHYQTGDDDYAKSECYLPIAMFTTAYARNDIIRNAQLFGDTFVYADTDSIHTTSNEIPNNFEIGKELGQWKNEGTYETAKYLRPKLYIHGSNNKVLEIKAAGATYECKKQMNFKNFLPDAEFDGKLTSKTVPGGCVLKETTYKIRI